MLHHKGALHEKQHRHYSPARLDSALSIRLGSSFPLACNEGTEEINPEGDAVCPLGEPNNQIWRIYQRGFDY